MKRVQRIDEKAFNAAESTSGFVVPVGEPIVKIRVEANPADKVAVGRKVRVELRKSSDNSLVAYCETDSYGPGGRRNRKGVVNPDEYIRVQRPDIAGESLYLNISGNGMRAAISVDTLTPLDYLQDDDDGSRGSIRPTRGG